MDEEESRKAGLLYRRGELSPMSSHMTDRNIGATSPGYIPSARAVPEARRNFSLADKTRILRDACALAFRYRQLRVVIDAGRDLLRLP